MADPNARTSPAGSAEANAGRQQGLGQGQAELDAGRDPSRTRAATNPEQRSFTGDMDESGSSDRPSQADFREMPDRNAAGIDDVPGDLGAGTPPNVDIHKLGQKDHPQGEWGEPAGEGAMHGANHTRRPERTEALRGQGAKTRTATKDQISRRS